MSSAAVLARFMSFLRLILPNFVITNSLNPDPRRLDDRPPFLDLGLVEGAEGLGPLLIARENILAEIVQARAHGRVRKRIHDRSVEFDDDLLRRGFLHPQAVPDRS